jgi:Ca-activated chloride channel family protein
MNSSAVNHWFAQPDYLSLAFLVPVLSVLSILAARRRRKALLRMGRVPALVAMVDRRRHWQGTRFFCLVMGLSILAVGIAGPQWGREPVAAVARGRDLAVVLDLSRSMLADDVLPSRMAHARQAAVELIANLQQRGGHRIALVAFAGRARIICPLTHDYDHFREKLEELDAENLLPELRAGPESASGTRIGAALALAVEAHDASFLGKQVQDIILLSDGDDPARDNEYFIGIQAAQTAGIPVHTIGIGNPDEARPIILGREVLKHRGETVKTRLEEAPLREIAEQTKGTYIAARTGPVPLVELFRGKIEPGLKREAVDEAPPTYIQRYEWFFAAALLLFILEMTLGPRVVRKASREHLLAIRERKRPEQATASRERQRPEDTRQRPKGEVKA